MDGASQVETLHVRHDPNVATLAKREPDVHVAVQRADSQLQHIHDRVMGLRDRLGIVLKDIEVDTVPRADHRYPTPLATRIGELSVRADSILEVLNEIHERLEV